MNRQVQLSQLSVLGVQYKNTEKRERFGGGEETERGRASE